MWYLIHMDDGIIDTASTKRSIINRNAIEVCQIECHKLGRLVYHCYTGCNNGVGHDYYLFSSKKQAIATGFEWTLFEE